MVAVLKIVVFSLIAKRWNSFKKQKKGMKNHLEGHFIGWSKTCKVTFLVDYLFELKITVIKDKMVSVLHADGVRVSLLCAYYELLCSVVVSDKPSNPFSVASALHFHIIFLCHCLAQGLLWSEHLASLHQSHDTYRNDFKIWLIG